MEGWIKGNGRKHICKIVSKEMDAAKPMLKMNISEVTPDFIERWDVNSIMGPVAAATPMWTAILHAASEPSEVWRTETVASDTRNRPTTRNIISSSVHYLRSLASCKVQLILGTTAWASGASRRTLDILHQSASSVSYSSIGHVVEALANSSIEAARKLVKSSPHCFAYDNINLSHSIFIEQTPNAPSKVQSGTLPVIYELSANVNPDDMKLEPILARFRAAPPLELSALRPSRKAARYFLKQSMINIIDPLLKFIKGFHYLEGDSLLKHPERRPLPNGHKTKFYCLRVSTHEEASIHGNILLHDNVYRDQLQVDVEGPVLNSTAIPTINDQLTNARIRGAQAVRMKDVSPYEQRIIFQIGFGLFHLIMNLLWGILSVHRGTLHDLGSLSYFFAILEKTRLGEKKPDYHTLLAALTQIVHGLLLNAWRIECGFPSLAEYAASKPSASAVLEKAWTIIKKYATPTCKQDPAEPLAKEPKPKPRRSGAGARRAAAGNADSGDQVFSNTVLLIRDMLYVLELVNASSSGDFGRVEDILPDIACIFHGTGSTNYSNEVLHFLYNIKHVWTPEYANIMRDNMLVNPSGREGHAMPMDLNIEHLIGELKKQYSSKGIYGSWDYLGNISACIDSLQKMKKQVSTSLKAAYQGTRHSDVDVSDLVWRVARNAQDRQLLEQIPVRDGVPRPTTVPDVRLLGRKTFESASLATFNKKLQEFKSGIPMECEPSADDIDPITDSIPEVEL
ncbi:hypothetical protein CPC08DRAFT_552875 [Agrocybe pediades]|nr:hypothetical protein CPC08DRAFT_552875 [Agrocybe pediades]